MLTDIKKLNNMFYSFITYHQLLTKFLTGFLYSDVTVGNRNANGEQQHKTNCDLILSLYILHLVFKSILWKFKI